MSNTYNLCILENYFPHELKSGNISSFFKKDDAVNKKNYRSITILSSVSKIFDRLMYEQVILFAECFLSPFICGFRKGYNTQHTLLKVLETYEATIDNGGFLAHFLMDLSKAFLTHQLLLTKLHAYGFGRSTFKHFQTEDKRSKLLVHIARGEKLRQRLHGADRIFGWSNIRSLRCANIRPLRKAAFLLELGRSSSRTAPCEQLWPRAYLHGTKKRVSICD